MIFLFFPHFSNLSFLLCLLDVGMKFFFYYRVNVKLDLKKVLILRTLFINIYMNKLDLITFKS